MKKLKLFFACLLMAVLSIGQVWADPAAVGTTLFSEDFSGYAKDAVPSGSVTTATGRVVYGNANVTYSVTNGGGTTKIYTENSAGGTSPEILVGKSNGTLTIAGIPSGGAKAITVSYKQNKQKLKVESTTTGYSGSKEEKPTSVGANSVDITIADGSAETFTLVFTCTGSSNVRVDDILVTVKTAGEGGGSDPVDVTGVTLNKSELELEVDENETLTATVAPSNASDKSVSWSSDDEDVATVDDGVVTAVGEGSATITVTTTDGDFTATCEVTVTAAAPAVEYIKVTGDIEEGDYVIYYDGKAMKNTVASNRLSYESVTPVNNKIKNPSTAIVWHIAPAATEGYWTMYNEAVNKYAVCTGSNNQANLNASADNAIVSVVEVSEGNYNILSKVRQDAGSNNYYLRENTTYGFAFYGSGTGGALTLYKNSAAPAVAKPTISGETPFLTSTTVTLACSTTGAEIYYTTDGTDPKTYGTTGTSFSLTETATVRAIAKLGSDWSAEATPKTFTKIDALTTMDAIFEAATAAGSTATDVYVTFNDWVVTGVKNSNAYVTDGTKGFIIYTSSHGFNVGDIISGTAACKVQLYNGSAELTELPATKVTVNTGGSVSPVVLDADGIAALTGVNTGSVIKISGECSEESSKFYIGGVQLYNSLYSFSVSAGTSYECTGIYVLFNSTKEILPRSASDIEMSSSVVAVTGVELTESTASVEVGETVTLHASVEPGTATDKAIVWSVTSGNDKASVANGVVTGIAAGEAVIRAASHEDESIYDECTVTVTAADPTKHVVTFDATVDKTTEATELSITKGDLTIAVTEGDGRFNNGTDYRPYKNSVFTVSCSNGNITKIEFTCTSSKPITGFADLEGLDKANEVWTGNAASVSFTASGAQVQMTQLVITYKEDARPAAGLAWDPSDDIELTVGDAFTAPTLLNPNSIDAAEITIESSNPSVATVTAGVVALVADATGTTTITATFAGNASYKPATVSYDITVNPAALTDYYEKVTETAGIVEGTYLIVYEEESLAFDGSLATLDAESNTIPVTIVGGNKIGVTSTTEASTFYIDPAAGTVKSASDHYIGVSSWGNGLKQTDTYVHNVLEIDGDENAQVGIYNADWNTTGGTMRLQYNKSAGQTRFRYYKNGGQQPIALYKLHNEVIKPEAGLAWDPATDIEITVGDAFTAPTLLNPNSIDAAEITIESSNPSVATVTAGVVALVADATGTTTITATFAGNASYKPATVSYKITVNPAHSIYVSPGLNINFGSVTKDAEVEDKVITVTLTGVDAATATLEGAGASAFEFTPAALTASGDITISASSATAGTFAATLTISDDAGVAASKVVNLSLTVTEPEIIDDLTGTWVLATAVPAVGEKFIVAGTYNSVTKTMGVQNANNRAAVASSLSEGVLTPGESTKVFTLVDAGEGKFAIQASNGKYLSAAGTGTNNYLREAANYEAANAQWTISISEGIASVVASSSNRNDLQYNKSNPGLFSCYATDGQTPIQFYVLKKYTVTYAAGEGSGTAPDPVQKVEGETFSVAAADLFTAPEGKEFDKWNDGTNDYAPGETYTVGTSNVVLTAYWKDATPTPVYTEVRNGLTEGWYYTMCLDKAVTAVQGGSIWRVLSKAANDKDIILEEVTGNLDAGRPYIFRAAASTLEVAYTGDAVLAPVTEGNNGLVGSFSKTEIAQSPNNFIIYNNELYYVNSEKVYVGAYRAYLNMSGVPDYSNEPQQNNAPRRRVVMTVHGEQVATGFENLNASEKPVKLMIDGNIYILRGEKLYDATGRLVK